MVATVILAIANGVPQEKSDNQIGVDLYFLNEVYLRLEPETRLVDSADGMEMTKQVFDMLYEGPLSGALTRVMPRFNETIELKLVTRENSDERFLEIQMPKEYETLSPSEEQLLRSSIVWSMTELDFIKGIKFYIGDTELLKTDGEPMGFQNRGNVVVNPRITPEKVDTETVTLYYFNEDKKALDAEERVIFVNPDQPIEKFVVEQLIAGPRNARLVASVPPETKIKGDVKTEDGVCYINLSGDFVLKNAAGGDAPVLSVYAIVNSLTELIGVNKVQILIDGEKLDNFKGSVNLSMPLERDDALIAGYGT
jgi:germination protein M